MKVLSNSNQPSWELNKEFKQTKQIYSSSAVREEWHKCNTSRQLFSYDICFRITFLLRIFKYNINRVNHINGNDFLHDESVLHLNFSPYVLQYDHLHNFHKLGWLLVESCLYFALKTMQPVSRPHRSARNIVQF